MAENVLESIPRSIADDEELGRHAWSRTNAKKVLGRQRRGESPRVPVSEFKPPRMSCELSVDRMNLADWSELAELAVKNTTRKDPTFQGWYTLKATDVANAKCTVQCTPTSGNLYHADILIPIDPSAADSRDDLMEFARNLAYLADFEPWGHWRHEVTVENPNQPQNASPSDRADPD